MTAEVTSGDIFSRAWCAECLWGLNDSPGQIQHWADMHNKDHHPSAMRIEEKALEAAAEAFYMSGPAGRERHWDDLPRAQKIHFRKRARIALIAAAPYLAGEQ